MLLYVYKNSIVNIQAPLSKFKYNMCQGPWFVIKEPPMLFNTKTWKNDCLLLHDFCLITDFICILL